MIQSDRETVIDSWDFWNPLVITSSIYCIMGMLGSMASSSNVGQWFACLVAGMFLAMSQLTSIYAALGAGSYWKRLFVSQSCFLFFGLSIIGGFSIAQADLRNSEFSVAILLVTIASSLGGQIMYGLFRFVGNWRFHVKGMRRGPIYDLSDLFAVTTFLAVSLAALNAMSPNARENVPAVLVTAGLILVATLVYGVPTLIFTFSGKDSEQGCFSQLIILGTIGFLVIVPFAAIGATMVIMPMLLFICSGALFTWLPLAFMRDHGFELTKGKEPSSPPVKDSN